MAIDRRLLDASHGSPCCRCDASFATRPKSRMKQDKVNLSLPSRPRERNEALSHASLNYSARDKLGMKAPVGCGGSRHVDKEVSVKSLK